MDGSDLHELQCIAPIVNLVSIARLGILSHKGAAKLDHGDVSSVTIQDRRRGKQVPHKRAGGRELHDYANVYICARNPMMYVLRHRHTDLAVLRVSCDVLGLDGVLIADGNASSDYTRFWGAPEGLKAIDAEITFKGDPRHANQFEYFSRKRQQCAEVLVPGGIPPQHIIGAYVSCEEALRRIEQLDVPWDCIIDPNMFFQP